MTDSIYALLSSVMSDVQTVAKTGRNTDQNYSFRGVDAVVNAVGPMLRKHNVLLLPELLDAVYRDVQTSRGKPAREVTVRVRYSFIGPAGDSLEVVVPGESMDSGDKGTAKAMSVAYRIALLQTLCIPTDEPDPDEGSYERDNRRPAQVQPDPAVEELNAAKAEVKAAWETAGGEFTVAKVEEYYLAYTGSPLSSAGIPELRAFAKDLREGTAEVAA